MMLCTSLWGLEKWSRQGFFFKGPSYQTPGLGGCPVEKCRLNRPGFFPFFPGISMELLETKRGVQYFAFEHHREYQQVQFKFLDAVESMDPNNLVVRNQGSTLMGGGGAAGHTAAGY